MEGYIAEIRMFGGNFAPRSWALCQGQILSIAQNTALFSLLGTTFGGNGQTTFALPDFRSRIPVGIGQGPGLTNVDLGEIAGTESVTLLINNLPVHTHGISGTLTVGGKAEKPGTTNSPVGNYHSILSGNSAYSATTDGDMATIPSPTVGVTGGSQPFNHQPPGLGINFVICLEGIYPSRN